jgi:8-oxo-dGTP pyrophosphatase MutT (NUDIX family)
MKMSDFKFSTERTICFLLKDSQIVLGMKKTGFGKGNYNGFGGKLEHGEAPEEAAARELYEEAGVLASKSDLEKKAVIDFNFPFKTEYSQRVHVYFAGRWFGEPRETVEMKPEYFDMNAIPYGKMWDSDRIWLPQLIAGKKINAFFVWKEDNKTVDTYMIYEIKD